MAHRYIAIGVLWRFMGYGAGLGLLCGCLYSLLVLPLITLLTGPSNSSNLVLYVTIGAVIGSAAGAALGLIMGILIGLIAGLLTFGILRRSNNPLGKPFQVRSTLFAALLATLLCGLMLIWIKPLPQTAQNFVRDYLSILSMLAIIVLSCTWAGYRITTWVINVQDQSLEVWDEPY